MTSLLYFLINLEKEGDSQLDCIYFFKYVHIHNSVIYESIRENIICSQLNFIRMYKYPLIYIDFKLV